MSEKIEFKNAGEYYDSQPEEVRKVLLELRDYILKAAPSANEGLNYNIPAYALVENGKR